MNQKTDLSFGNLGLEFFRVSPTKPQSFRRWQPFHNISFPDLTKELKEKEIIAIRAYLKPLISLVRGLLREFQLSLPAKEGKHLVVTSIDLRRYALDTQQSDNLHADGGAIGLIFSPNQLGPILSVENKIIRSGPWQLVAISNEDRARIQKNVLPTLHGSPVSKRGRLFVRITLGYTEFESSVDDSLKDSLEILGL